MAIGDINPGYMGYANIEGIGNVRFSDASLVATQEVNAPDLVTGHWDHMAWNYGPINVAGSISGPVTENFAAGGSSIWEWAAVRSGSTCGGLEGKDVTLYYFCDRGSAGRNSRTFDDCLVNSLNFSCAAGDVANFSLDLIGLRAGSWTTSTPTLQTNAEKLLTWDKVSVSVTGPGGSLSNVNYSNFEFTVANNIETKYSLGQAYLFPFDLVPGMRTITGTLTVYNIPEADGVDTWDSYTANDVATLTFNIGSSAISFKAALHRIAPALQVGAITSTIAFTAVTDQSFD